MKLHIYNSLSQKKELFQPLKPNHINMYVCGITVYDHCHIGHARVMVAFDAIIRFLRSQGYQVNYVRNITDIDDKIIKRAAELQESMTSLTERMIVAMNEDFNQLGVLLPDHEPKATEYVSEIITMIEKLIQKGFAYVADNGDVYYEVEKFKSYGCLSHKDLSGQESGARVDVVESKRNPLDFVLWKLAKLGEPSWDSPWGSGRPGWHIECSAMSSNLLGDTFDIHGGGFDLQFPHHENEIAQSEAASGKLFVKTWMHVGFLQIKDEKMSKSLGNFFTIREVLQEYEPEVIRYFLLSSHYRSQLNYSKENLELAKQALERFYQALTDLPETPEKHQSTFTEQFVEAMNDDFNTPEAVAVLFELAREINRLKKTDMEQAAQLGSELKSLGQVLGLLQQQPHTFLQGRIQSDEVTQIEALIAQRTEARRQKNWAESDRIRDQLHALGVELLDGASGTTWRKI
ncbi:MAG: cysteine--tRNA ligase [Proteobacteria bacterium]|nr:cysteine--tRNA ligase [Pseudomonadota bacterium]